MHVPSRHLFSVLAFCAALLVAACRDPAVAAGLQRSGTQPTGPVGAGATAGSLRALTEEGYRLCVGDVLVIEVEGAQKLSGQFQIGSAGTIAMPYLGVLRMKGRTLQEARAVITEKARGFVRRPRVSVFINEGASVRRVFIGGEVNNPGMATLSFQATLADALAHAVPRPTADLKRVRLTHPGRGPVEVDCSGEGGEATLGLQHRLEDGDTVFVPRAPRRTVTVLGQVTRPGTVELPAGERVTVLDLITLAQGLAPTADRSAAILMRVGQPPRLVKLEKLLGEGDTSENLEVNSGDVLLVPRGGGISVVGQVAKPVALAAPAGMSVLEALTQAGGALSSGDLRQAQIIRGEETLTVDLETFLEKGRSGDELMLRPGDILVIPPGPNRAILIAGAVGKPSTLDLSGTAKDLLSVVTNAGPQADADLTRVNIYRGQERLVRNLRAAFESGDRSQNLELAPGDLVYVPSRRTGSVLVTGAVGQRGVVAIGGEEGSDLLRVVIGAAPLPTADLSRVRVQREGAFLVKDLRAAVEEGRVEESVALQDGDVVVVPEVAERTAIVTGAVQRSGPVPVLMGEERDLARVVMAAGPSEAADLSRVTVQRNGQRHVVDVQRYVEQGDRTQTLSLQPGDVVIVPSRELRVLFTGAVTRPGLATVTDESLRELSRALMALAGPTSDADLARVSVRRGDESLVVNVRRHLDTGDPAQAFRLEDGDLVVVPTSRASVLVMGAVARGGPMPLPEGQADLLHMVTAAGPSADADLTRVTVYRSDETLVRNLKLAMESGDRSQNLELKPGDLLFVPSQVAGSVLVTGAVANQGVVPVGQAERADLLRIVVGAGPSPTADLARVRVHRRGQVLVRDLKTVVETGQATESLAVEDGDVVVVPSREIRVFFSGAVARPGVVTIADDSLRDLAGALATLASPLPNADLGAVTIRRGEETLTCNVDRYLKQGSSADHITLEDGDFVVVPSGEHTVLVTGAVIRGGPTQLVGEEQRDLLRVVTAAGPTPEADLSRITVLRGGESLVRDVRKALEEGDRSQTLLLQDGDIVRVPSYGTQTVIVAGAVSKTGVMELGSAERGELAVVVSSAGPLPTADLTRVAVHRAGEVLVRDVDAYLLRGDKSQGLLLQGGDVVVVPTGGETALLTGALARTGPVRVSSRDDRDLVRLILAADPLPSSDLSRVTIYREGDSQVYDLSALQRGGPLDLSVPVLPGDRVFVPSITPTNVLIVGAVSRQGLTQLMGAEQRELVAAVMAAGPLATADLSRVTLLRNGEVAVYDVKSQVQGQSAVPPILLQEGDRVIVPELGPGGIMVTGRVARAGAAPEVLGGRNDLLRVVMSAGPDPATADLSRVTVWRRGEKIQRDLRKLQEEGDLSQNMDLEPGDIVFVPEATDTVVVVGEVQKPGPVLLRSLTTPDILRLLSTAGLTPNADAERITIYRQGEVLECNYRDIVARGDLSQNLTLQPGDVISVPPDTRHEAMVLGAVQHIGPINVRDPFTSDLLRIVLTAKPNETADLSRVMIFRADSEPVCANLQKAIDEGDVSQRVLVQPGDVVMVPTLDRLYVIGGVMKPGMVPARPGWDVMDALAAAGNISPNAQQRVILVRRLPDGRPQRFDLDLSGMVPGKLPERVEVQAGDVLYVPFGKAKRDTWRDIRDMLYTVTGLIGLLD